jgi:cytochrome c oxidase subunit 2
MENLLIVLVVVLAVIGVAQIARVYKVSSDLGKRREEDVSPISNKVNANLMLGFVIALFLFFFWELWAYREVFLPPAASKHGVEIDELFTFNWVIIFIVFFSVNFMLFFFAKKYAYDPKRKAKYLAHNNTLELVWTVIPAIVLAVLIIYGLRTWNQIMDDPSEDALTVELYGKQFDWTARYAGDDERLGETNFTLISSQNPLGLITQEKIKEKITKLTEDIEKAEKQIATEVLPDSKIQDLEDKIGMRTRQRARVMNYRDSAKNFATARDDKIMKGEIHLPVNQQVNLQIRARDVIHSAYMPHFRVQMNAVPGMVTEFKFTPTITTDSMRTITDDEQFNYILLCNKVCGSAHYNMQMNIVVESRDKYKEWLKEQETFVAPEGAKEGEQEEEMSEEETVAVKQ